MKLSIIENRSNIDSMFLGIITFVFGLVSFIFGLGLFFFRGQPIYFYIAKIIISLLGVLYMYSGAFLLKLKSMIVFGLVSFIFGLGLFLFHNIYIYYAYYILVLVYLILSAFLLKLKSMIVFGLVSFIFGLGLFLFRGQPIHAIESLLVSVGGFIYIIASISLFRLKNWSRKIIIISSSFLLLYFLPVSIYFIFDPWGWAQLVVPIFLPYILFPLFSIIFFSHPKIKEQFKK